MKMEMPDTKQKRLKQRRKRSNQRLTTLFTFPTYLGRFMNQSSKNCLRRYLFFYNIFICIFLSYVMANSLFVVWYSASSQTTTPE